MITLVRLLSLVLLITLSLAPISIFEIMKRPDIQLVAATLIVAILVIYDIYSGFILAFAIIILYLRLYGNGFAFINDDRDIRKKGPMANLVTKYITPQHLKDAQTNSVEGPGVDTEIIGIKGVYGEPVYGAQGLDKMMPGFESSKSLIGDHWSM